MVYVYQNNKQMFGATETQFASWKPINVKINSYIFQRVRYAKKNEKKSTSKEPV